MKLLTLQFANFTQAVQLMSETTALTIKRIFPDDPEMLRFADFIHAIDDWFDVHNSCAKSHKSKPLKCGYEG